MNIIFALLMMLGLSASAASLNSVIADGPNKGLMMEQVIGYRVAGVARLAKDAQQETLATKEDLTRVQGQYDKVTGERDWFHADDDKNILGKTYWRKRAQVILYALALAFGWWFYGKVKPLCLSPVLGWIGLVIPYAAALLGAAIGYAFGLYVLGWLAHFLP